jgi:hypothetical protein
MLSPEREKEIRWGQKVTKFYEPGRKTVVQELLDEIDRLRVLHDRTKTLLGIQEQLCIQFANNLNDSETKLAVIEGYLLQASKDIESTWARKMLTVVQGGKS